MGGAVPDVLQSARPTSSSSVVQVGTLPKFLDQWISITSNKFRLNMGKAHHLQLGCCPLLFCMVELLGKGATEPSTGAAGFYSNVYVVPKCTGSL